MKKEKISKEQNKKNEDVLNLATYVILFVTTLIFILSEPVHRGSTPFYITILLFALILLLNIFSNDLEKVFGSEETATWVFLISNAILILSAAWVGRFFNIIFLIFMLAAQTYIMLRFKPASIMTSFVIAGYILILKGLGLPWEGVIDVTFSLSVGLVFVITLSIVLQRYAEQKERVENLNTQLVNAHEQLLIARQKELELAAAEERVRLARDIHDGLGHHLTTLNIQLQAAEKLIANKPEKAIEAIQISRHEAKAALEEVRHSVAVMRRNPLDGKTLVEAIGILISEYNRSIENEILFEHAGIPDNLSPQISNTVYRAIQEGLTNIKKHAVNTNEIRISLQYDSSKLICFVQDNGSLAADDQINSGFGLAGIRERVEQLGGVFTAEKRHPQGFQLKIEFSLLGADHD